MAKKAVTYAVNMSAQDKLEAEARHDIATERGCFMSEVSDQDVRERLGPAARPSRKQRRKKRRKTEDKMMVSPWALARAEREAERNKQLIVSGETFAAHKAEYR